MKTKAVRIYGAKDLRIEEFELPPLKDDEILATLITDSVCMSSYKAAVQGPAHKRVPNDIAENPTIIGHEFCGEILEVGKKWADSFSPGQRFTIQPALNYKGSLDAPGYSYQYIGGNATNIIIPNEVMEMDCLLPYNGDSYFMGSLAEPMSCIVGTFHAMYHIKQGTYVHKMGIVEGGNMAIIAGAGPMGLGSIDYAVNNPVKPGKLVVTDIDQSRLDRAAELFSPEEAKKQGVELVYLNTRDIEDPSAYMVEMTGGEGYHDVLIMAPVKALVEQGNEILAKDGCLNFFAGPNSPDFTAELNFYNVHYLGHHIVGTSGGNTEDLRESLQMMEQKELNPAGMITHVGGMNTVPETVLNLPSIPGGKKLMYNHIELPLTAIADFEKLGKEDQFFADLHEIVGRHNGLWCKEAEDYLLANGKTM